MRWRRISTGQQKPNTSGAFALHVEAYAPVATSIKADIRRLYGTSATTFPLGIKMRFVPEYRAGQISLNQKIAVLRNRQERFLALTMSVHYFQTSVLDRTDVAFGEYLTMRNAIMSIVHPQDTNSPNPKKLFHAVNPHWHDPNAICFTFLRAYEDEAREYIVGLLPFLYTIAGNATHCQRLHDFFSFHAVEFAESNRWDVTNHRLITAEDEQVDEILLADTEFNFDNPVDMRQLPKELHASRAFTTTFEIPDDDSVSTFGSLATRPTPMAPKAPPKDDVSVVSVTKSVSSLDTLQSILAQQQMTFQAEMAAIRSSMATTIAQQVASAMASQLQNQLHIHPSHEPPANAGSSTVPSADGPEGVAGEE
jgi:hypothetical protein